MNASDDPDAVSAAFRIHRSKLICPGCNTSNKISFSSDGNGKLRFGCQNRIKSCRKSFSVKTMALMLEAVSPNVFSSTSNSSTTSLVTSNLTKNSSSTLFGRQINPSSTTSGSKIIRNQDSLPHKFAQARNDNSINGPGIRTNLDTSENNQSLVDKNNHSTRLNPVHPINNNNIDKNTTQAVTINNPISNSVLQNNHSEDVDTSFDLKQVIIDQQLLIKQQSVTLTLLQEQVQTLAKQMLCIADTLKDITSNSNFSPNQVNTNHPTRIVSIDTSNTNTITPPTPTTNGRKTYAQIAASRGIAEKDQPVAIQALEQLCKRPRIRKTFKNLDKIYIQGISRQPIKNLKQLFQSLRIRTSAIPSISFLGLQTAEFLVSSDYSSSFKKIITSLSPTQGRFKILENYDASKAADPIATTEVKQKLQAAFVRRVHGLIEHNTNKSVQEFYNSWLQKLSLPIPNPPEKEINTLPKEITPQSNVNNQQIVNQATAALPGFISEPENSSITDSESDSEEESVYQTEARSPDLSRFDTPDIPEGTAQPLII